jgi:hypothetical protein
VVVWRIGFGVPSPSRHPTIAETVMNNYGYKGVGCLLVGSTEAPLYKCTANRQSIGLFLLEPNGVVDRVSTR